MSIALPRRLRALLAVLALGACNRSTPPEPAPPQQQPLVEAPLPVDDSFRLPAAERLVAFGDVHGDLPATRQALRLAGAIDESDHWIGGKLVVVQTGDQLDRGDDEAAILDLFERLRDEAQQAGGGFHALNGNHEIMNVSGDFRYVTPKGFAAWANVSADGPRARWVERFPSDERGRAAAFLPGGPMALKLAERPVVLAVGDSVFVHGGLLEPHVRYGLGRLNAEARRWMRGEVADAPRLIQSDSGPVWTREYSEHLPSAEQCDTLAQTLRLLHVKRLVVGHTVQKHGINNACGGKVWRIDVGLSKYYGGAPTVLEIIGDRTRVITANSDDQLVPARAVPSGPSPAASAPRAPKSSPPPRARAPAPAAPL
jgi:hypothetical protein